MIFRPLCLCFNVVRQHIKSSGIKDLIQLSLQVIALRIKPTTTEHEYRQEKIAKLNREVLIRKYTIISLKLSDVVLKSTNSALISCQKILSSEVQAELVKNTQFSLKILKNYQAKN